MTAILHLQAHSPYYLYARARGAKKQFIRPTLQQLFSFLLQLFTGKTICAETEREGIGPES